MSKEDPAEQEKSVSRLINLRSWAVVGVSQDARKFGYRVFKALQESGYDVMGVNPKGGKVLGRNVYPTVANLPRKPDVVVTVVPPEVTERIVNECAKLGIANIWMQPGSESDTAILAARESGMTLVAHDCAMVRRKLWSNAS